MKKIAIIGATGATGLELVKLALKDGFSPSELVLIASEKSVGKVILIENQTFTIASIDAIKNEKLDVIFLAAGSKVSKIFKSNHHDKKTLVIDLASHYRQDENIPLVIPEINKDACDFKKDTWICSPNCVTTIYLVVLAPLIKAFGSKKVILSTYQAASGAGFFAMQELKNETHAYLQEQSYEPIAFKDPYAFNLFCHNAPFEGHDDNEEEIKIKNESKKILNDPSFKVSATCVRVPTLRAHAISAYAIFEKSLTKTEIHEVLKSQKGIKLYENFSENRFATVQIATCQDDVYYGRIRKDPDEQNAFWFWIVGDQLLKGASLNAWQIYNLKRSYETLHANAGTTRS